MNLDFDFDEALRQVLENEEEFIAIEEAIAREELMQSGPNTDKKEDN